MSALFPRAAFDIVSIAASAGGVSALQRVFRALPPDFPCAVAVVQHQPAHSPWTLADVLGFRSRLTVRFARPGDRLRAGTIYVAAPDRHLRVTADRRFAYDDSERINYVRPAADPLFASAAAVFGSRTLALVMTGMGRDGAAGTRRVRAAGGCVLAQDPISAEAPFMPAAAIATASVNLTLPLEALAHALVSLVMVAGTSSLLGHRAAA